MPDHEVSAVYDHEIEDGSRRRSVADWGVGEELFDRMPSRRRFRPSEVAAARRDVHGGEVPRHSRERDARPGDATHHPRERDVHVAEARERRFAGAEAEHKVRAEPREEPTPPAVADVPVEREAPAQPAEGRRTVVIRGRGSEPAAMPRRSRPPRTAGERIGPRPDRVAAWAVALGVLLILIAILTAH